MKTSGKNKCKNCCGKCKKSKGSFIIEDTPEKIKLIKKLLNDNEAFERFKQGKAVNPD